MTTILIILILLLSAILIGALRTLQKRRIEPQLVYVKRSPTRLSSTISPQSDLSLINADAPNDDLVLASLLEASKDLDKMHGRQCRRCFRVFGEQSGFCYVDGTPLQEGVSHESTFFVCTGCGHEGSEPCACEDGVFRIGRHQLPSIPLIPAARCPSCQKLGPMNSYCSADGVRLEPVFDLNFSCFPARGFGPRRSVCLKCGEGFSDVANYCSFDGERLTLLN